MSNQVKVAEMIESKLWLQTFRIYFDISISYMQFRGMLSQLFFLNKSLDHIFIGATVSRSSDRHSRRSSPITRTSSHRTCRLLSLVRPGGNDRTAPPPSIVLSSVRHRVEHAAAPASSFSRPHSHCTSSVSRRRRRRACVCGELSQRTLASLTLF